MKKLYLLFFFFAIAFMVYMKYYISGRSFSSSSQDTNRTVFMGGGAGFGNKGTGVTAVGYRAGSDAGGADNVFLGNIAGQGTNGADLVCIGDATGLQCSDSFSTFIGDGCGRLSKGAYNIGIGNDNLRENVGSFNIGIGIGALDGNTGSNMVYIGNYMSAINTNSGCILLGTNVTAHVNNQFAISDSITSLRMNLSGGMAGMTLVRNADSTASWQKLNYSTVPFYANDMAADADSKLPSGGLYRVKGSRALLVKP